MPDNIVAGRFIEINDRSGQWLIIDIGFSSKEPSCGVLNHDEEARVVTFAELKQFVIREVRKDSEEPLNMLIEAPLSVAFQQSGNPTRRLCDIQDGKFRDFYVNAGASTLIATSYLLRSLVGCEFQRKVKLFEGHVSFKRPEDRPKTKAQKRKAHKKDVMSLKSAVWNRTDTEIFDLRGLRWSPDHRIESAFPFLHRHLIPPVIRVTHNT